MTDKDNTLRSCMLDPIPEIFVAQELLNQAAIYHLDGQPIRAAEAIREADIEELYFWAEAIWGKSQPDSGVIQKENLPAVDSVPACTNPKKPLKNDDILQNLIERDGYHCRWCEIPLIEGKIATYLKQFYPMVIRWGKNQRNHQKHAAFQAMQLVRNWIIPKSKGGAESPDNLVISCAPCAYGRGDAYPIDKGLISPVPRHGPSMKSDWDGLTRVLPK